MQRQRLSTIPRLSVPVSSVLLLGCTIVVFSRVLFGEHNMVLSKTGLDYFSQFSYWRHFGFDQLRHGNLALWNPHIFSGMPFFGGFQAALLYPPNFSYLILPLAEATNITVAMHVMLTGIFMYLWTSRRGLHPCACMVSSILLMFCGPYFKHIHAGHLPHLCTMAWAPLLFLSIDGFFEKQSLPWALLGMLAISMQILAGYPQHFFYTALAAALYSMLRMVNTRHRIPLISGLAIMYAGGAALGAVQLLTGIDLARQSVRSGNFLSDFVSKFSLPPENLVTLIAPDFFGNDMTFPYWGRWYAWEMTFFVGITGLFLALYGSIYGERSVRRFSVTMASVLTLLALGPATPLFGILHAWLPAFDKFRGTSKFIFQASLFITMLAGVGVDHMIRSSRISWKPILIIAFAAVLVGSGALYILTCIQGSNPANFWQKAMSALRATNQFYIPEGTYLQPRFFENAGFFAAKCLIIAFATLVILLLLYLMARPSRIGVYAIVLLSVVEILLFARNALVSFDATTIQRQDIAHFLANNPGNYRILSPRYPNSAMLTNAKDIWGYDSVVLRRYAEFVSFTQGDPPEKASQYVLFSRFHPLFALLRCRFFFLPEGKDTRIIENQSVLPHVQLVENYRVIPNRDGILAAMTDPSFNPRQMVILEREPDPEPSMCNQQGMARVVDSSTDHLTIEARLPASAILLITDAYSEGWHASALAGSSQERYEVIPADYVLRAIPLSKGYHRIRLEYLPLAFRIGKWTSIASAVIYIILLAFCIRKVFRGRRFTED